MADILETLVHIGTGAEVEARWREYLNPGKAIAPGPDNPQPPRGRGKAIRGGSPYADGQGSLL